MSRWSLHRRYAYAALVAGSLHAQAMLAQQPGAPPPPPAPPPAAPPPSAPTPPPPAPASAGSYRAPWILLVQPQDGGVVPQDKPLAVFRFAQGEANDPLDARSFAVSVDGEDRTSLFQQTGSEAWGPLAAPGIAIARGSHEVHARICSSRGACIATKALITVAPAGLTSSDKGSDRSNHRKSQLLDALLTAVRSLLTN